MTLKIGVNVLHDLGGDSAPDHNLQRRHDHNEFKFGVIYKDMSVRNKWTHIHMLSAVLYSDITAAIG